MRLFLYNKNMNREPRHEISPETPRKINYTEILQYITYIADHGFSVERLLKQVRDSVVFNLSYSTLDIRETNRLLDVMNDIDAMLKAIENPS